MGIRPIPGTTAGGGDGHSSKLAHSRHSWRARLDSHRYVQISPFCRAKRAELSGQSTHWPGQKRPLSPKLPLVMDAQDDPLVETLELSRGDPIPSKSSSPTAVAESGGTPDSCHGRCPSQKK